MVKLKIRCLFAGILIAVMLVCPVSAASAFLDVDEHSEYWPAIEFVSEMKVMVGDEQGNFNPNRTVTRAEMAGIACRLKGSTYNLTTSAVFSDVPIDHWANAYISEAAKLGIVKGYGDGTFGPSDIVTYEQAITMIVRAVGGPEYVEEGGGYPDGYIAAAVMHGFLNGVNAKKGEEISRADIALIAYNYSLTLG